ncbi:MAG: WG repeat-containing protein [Flavobacterium sp.]
MKKIFTLLVLLVTGLMYSQEVLVPFRVGDKFGLSDLNGKMKLEAKYEFINPEKDGNFTFEDEGVSGLIIGGKEIISLPGEFRFELVKGKFIVAKAKGYIKNEQGRKVKNEKILMFTTAGKSLIDRDYKNLQMVYAYGGKNDKEAAVFVFHVHFADGTQALYVFDAQKQKVTDKLFEKSSNIKPIDRDIEANEIFVGVTTADGKAAEYVLSYKNGKVVASPSAGREKPFAKAKKAEKDNVEVVQINPGDYDNVAVPDVPMDDRADLTTKVKHYNTTLALDDKTITATYKGYYSQKEITSKKMELPKEATDIVRGNWLMTFTSPGKSQNVYNYVAYTVNGKKGIFLTDSLHVKPAYDELTLVKFKKGNSNFPALIVGNKDKAGRMKYGIINEKTETLVPIQYDKIDYLLDENYSRGQSVKTLEDYMVVLKDGKYGIINYKNVEMLPVKYTEIIRKSDSYSTTYTLRNGDKYGILKFEFNTQKDFADAFFPYPVGFVLKDYAGVKGKDMIWLEKDGRLFCYARPDGFLYYKP